MSDELRDRVRGGQGFAREQRRQKVGRPGCDECGVRPARVVGMVGTAAARERLCSECRMLRRIATRKEGECR